jgi:cytochrome c551/c552
MNWLGKAALGVGGVAVLIQLVSFEHTNPPVTGELVAPTEVKALLKRACFDCHSHETTWPWYTNVAPVSWLVHRDVVEGRKHLNFSTWAQVAPDRQAKKLAEVADEVSEDGMPPWFYLPAHPDAKLTAAEKQAIIQWAKAGSGGAEAKD